MAWCVCAGDTSLRLRDRPSRSPLHGAGGRCPLPSAPKARRTASHGSATAGSATRGRRCHLPSFRPGGAGGDHYASSAPPVRTTTSTATIGATPLPSAPKARRTASHGSATAGSATRGRRCHLPAFRPGGADGSHLTGIGTSLLGGVSGSVAGKTPGSSALQRRGQSDLRPLAGRRGHDHGPADVAHSLPDAGQPEALGPSLGRWLLR